MGLGKNVFHHLIRKSERSFHKEILFVPKIKSIEANSKYFDGFARSSASMVVNHIYFNAFASAW